MIQANELRIGNYFMGIGGIQTVLSLEENTNRGKCEYVSEDHRLMYSHLILCHQNGNQYKPFEIDPIPLTEEILLKCGFIMSSSKSPLCSGPDPMLIWRTEYESDALDNHFEFRFGITQSYKAERQVRLDYLHQLQNLYFALTGQELNIEL